MFTTMSAGEENPSFDWLYPKEYRTEAQLVRPEIAYEIMEMMKTVFDKGGTGYWASYLTGLNKPSYGKSGTSQDWRDTWFVGFTPSEVSATWVGFDDYSKSILLPCASTSAYIWCDYNAKVSGNVSIPFEVPANMKLLRINTDTGLIATPECQSYKDFYFWNDGPVPGKDDIQNKDFFESGRKKQIQRFKKIKRTEFKRPEIQR